MWGNIPAASKRGLSPSVRLFAEIQVREPVVDALPHGAVFHRRERVTLPIRPVPAPRPRLNPVQR